MLRFDSEKWLKDYVRFNLEVGGAYHTAIAAGVALRLDRDDLMRRLDLGSFMAFSYVSEKMKVENTHPKAWKWCQDLTEEQARHLEREASAKLFLIGADEHCVEDICYARDEAESVITALLYSNYHDPMRDLLKHVYMFDEIFYNVVRGKITKEVSALMEKVVGHWTDAYWGYPAWHRSLMDVDFQRGDQHRMETIADDWEYLDTIYRRREECSAAVAGPGASAGTTN